MTVMAGLVALDGLAPVLAQYDPARLWNGWLCPVLDPHGVISVLEALNAYGSEGPLYAYDFEQEVLVLETLDYPGVPPERLPPDEDGLYALGAYAWVWSEAPVIDQPRHLRASRSGFAAVYVRRSG